MFENKKQVKETIKILIADDHEIIRESIKRMLDLVEDMTVVGLCENGFEAFEMVKETTPDIVLMDAIMPKCNGVESTKEIKKYDESIKVLMLTTFSDKKLIFSAFEAGIDGYILKDTTAKNLIRCIYDTMDGNLIIPNHIAQKLVKEIAINQKHIYTFNKTEEAIIKLLIEGLTNKEIAQKLYIGYGTTRNYVSDIYKKVGETDRKRALEKLDKRP